jgi:hypothetical protein
VTEARESVLREPDVVSFLASSRANSTELKSSTAARELSLHPIVVGTGTDEDI